MCKQVLGKGAFGVVYEATCLEDKKQYACKSISKAKLVTKVGKACLGVQLPCACHHCTTPSFTWGCTNDTTITQLCLPFYRKM